MFLFLCACTFVFFRCSNQHKTSSQALSTVTFKHIKSFLLPSFKLILALADTQKNKKEFKERFYDPKNALQMRNKNKN